MGDRSRCAQNPGEVPEGDCRPAEVPRDPSRWHLRTQDQDLPGQGFDPEILRVDAGQRKVSSDFRSPAALGSSLHGAL